MPRRKNVNKKPRKSAFRYILVTMIEAIIAVYVLFFVNANLVYLIKRSGGASFWNKIFPSNCRDPPFGAKGVSACGKQLPEFGDPPIKTKWKPDAKGCPPGMTFPYNMYRTNSTWYVSDFINWLVQSLANTNVSLNDGVKGTLGTADEYTTETILILFGFLMLWLLPLVFFGSMLLLIYNYVFDAFNRYWGTLIMILFFGLISAGTTTMLMSTYNILSVLFKLVLLPSVLNKYEYWPEVKKVMADYSKIPSLLLGFIWVMTIWDAPLDSRYSQPVKLATLAAYLFYLFKELAKMRQTGLNQCK